MRPELELPWDLRERFEKRFGFSRVEMIENEAAVAGYCSKYVLKAQGNINDHYEFYGSKFSWVT